MGPHFVPLRLKTHGPVTGDPSPGHGTTAQHPKLPSSSVSWRGATRAWHKALLERWIHEQVVERETDISQSDIIYKSPVRGGGSRASKLMSGIRSRAPHNRQKRLLYYIVLQLRPDARIR